MTVVHGTDRLESSMPGVFSVGDVRHRSLQRVACAIGESAAAIQSMYQYLGDEDSRAPA
jgi:thioredoxin reductase (NADPH)